VTAAADGRVALLYNVAWRAPGIAVAEHSRAAGALWWLYVRSFVNRFGSFVSVFLILYLVERGFSPGQAGTAAAAYGTGSFASAIVVGFLAHRLGRLNAMAISMFTAAASALALSQADRLALLSPSPPCSA
jgi:MFS family permease